MHGEQSAAPGTQEQQPRQGAPVHACESWPLLLAKAGTAQQGCPSGTHPAAFTRPANVDCAAKPAQARPCSSPPPKGFQGQTASIGAAQTSRPPKAALSTPPPLLIPSPPPPRPVICDGGLVRGLVRELWVVRRVVAHQPPAAAVAQRAAARGPPRHHHVVLLLVWVLQGGWAPLVQRLPHARAKLVAVLLQQVAGGSWQLQLVGSSGSCHLALAAGSGPPGGGGITNVCCERGCLPARRKRDPQ